MNNSTGKYWPYGIIIAMVLFILFFVYIVTTIYRSDYSLVSGDSYEEGLKFDNKKEAIKRTESLGVSIAYFNGSKAVKITFPEEIPTNMLQGTVYFYRPSSAKLDFNVPLKLNEKKEQFFNVEKLETGFWKIKLDFKSDSIEYFQEYSFSR